MNACLLLLCMVPAQSKQDLAYARKQYQQLMAAPGKMLDASLDSLDPRVRFAAVMVIGDAGLPLHEKLLPMILSDEDELVKQAVRRSLMLLSADILDPSWRKDKRRNPKNVDYGPTPGCSPEQTHASFILWQTWWEGKGKK